MRPSALHPAEGAVGEDRRHALDGLPGNALGIAVATGVLAGPGAGEKIASRPGELPRPGVAAPGVGVKTAALGGDPGRQLNIAVAAETGLGEGSRGEDVERGQQNPLLGLEELENAGSASVACTLLRLFKLSLPFSTLVVTTGAGPGEQERGVGERINLPAKGKPEGVRRVGTPRILDALSKDAPSDGLRLRGWLLKLQGVAGVIEIPPLLTSSVTSGASAVQAPRPLTRRSHLPGRSSSKGPSSKHRSMRSTDFVELSTAVELSSL
mmetsp:Transcript_115324/g.215984  ORF Transcript_115324/g.215984 Transcript_115324/m.215984 type:complete len:267 (+) Transcript_115324:1097-1897(+)